MEVRVAQHAGFCFGVESAVSRVMKLAETESAPIYTYGPLIHNEQVEAELAEMGVGVIRSREELQTLAGSGAIVVIRSHGVGEEVQREMQELGLRVEDATCPFVKKIHRIVRQAEEEGRRPVILGSPDHPEVQGICGWCADPTVVRNADEAERLSLPADRPLTIVAQTTFPFRDFDNVVEIICKKGYNVSVVNTICHATRERQSEAESIASSVERMIVIGGRNSSNTQKLFDICKKVCKQTVYIQTLSDLDLNKFRNVRSVGITAGASTPKKLIEEVHESVRNQS